MDNFTAIYKILSTLEAAMDAPSFELDQINYEKLHISEERWGRYMEMMLDTGLIKGVRVYNNILGELNVDDEGIRITLKGLEYLQENSFMKKAYKIAKGIKDVVPGI